MRVIPVIDLLHGKVVRGVAGQRDTYQPLKSRLCHEPEPRAVATAFSEQLRLETVYVADLDAILRHAPNWKAYEAIAAAGLELWIDAGLTSPPQAEKLHSFLKGTAGQGSAIAGLETVTSPALLKELIELVGPERLIFSLDLKAGKPLTRSAAWLGMDAEEILQTAFSLGTRRFIVLDLAQVGMAGGVGTEVLCQKLRAISAEVEITAGGGVRGVEDLRKLREHGCDAALVASALHDGGLGARELSEFR